MPKQTYDVVICGAGIAGVATGYHLAVSQGVKEILIVDERPPLSLTSDKSTEAYRNWWPGPDGAMIAMMNRSIDLLDKLAIESNNIFNMNRRGYLFATSKLDKVDEWVTASNNATKYGAGPIRLHDGIVNSNYSPPSPHGFENQLTGADIVTDQSLIRRHYPYLSEETQAVLHVRRAGWLSAQQLGKYLLDESIKAGVTIVQDQVEGILKKNDELIGIKLSSAGKIFTENFINAAGPFIKEIGKMCGIEIPVFSERHQKVSFRDIFKAVPRNAPLLIWSDPQRLEWSKDEMEQLKHDDEFSWLLNDFPGGVHVRPEGEFGGQIVLLLWEYNTPIIDPVFPVPFDDLFPELVIRGLGKMLPGMKAYLNRLPRTYVDGGYYTKTKENRPIGSPTPMKNVFVIGALSGFGIMASMAMGELLSLHVTNSKLPDYFPAFSLERYDDPNYRYLLSTWDDKWQL